MKGKYQVRKGRISHKSKRGVTFADGRLRLANTGVAHASLVTKGDTVTETVFVRNSQGQLVARVKQKFIDQSVADNVLHNVGDRLVERATDLPPVETQYVAPKTRLTLRLKVDEQGRNRESRRQLARSAKRLDFVFRSVYGPAVFENDETGNVEIRLHDEFDVALAATLRAAGWKQLASDRRMFVLPASREARLFAVDFAWMHAGEWYTLSSLTEEAIDFLRFGNGWHYPAEQITVPGPGNGTNEHAREFHRFRKPTNRNKLTDGLERGMDVRTSERDNNGHIVMEHVSAPKLKMPIIRPSQRDYRSTSRQYVNACGRRDRHHAGYSFGETGTKLPFGR